MKSKIDWVRRGQRLIRMVSELHRLGYQQLRIMPYMHPLAWRLAIGPRDVFSPKNGAVLKENFWDVPIYTSADGANYFGWKDAAGDNARQLAEKFIERFPAIAERGKGRDWAYAGWLAELVGLLEGGDYLPIMEWENSYGRAVDLKFVPIWSGSISKDMVWLDGPESPGFFPGPDMMKYPLPPATEQQGGT